jgi:hypothetical protein
MGGFAMRGAMSSHRNEFLMRSERCLFYLRLSLQLDCVCEKHFAKVKDWEEICFVMNNGKAYQIQKKDVIISNSYLQFICAKPIALFPIAALTQNIPLRSHIWRTIKDDK